MRLPLVRVETVVAVRPSAGRQSDTTVRRVLVVDDHDDSAQTMAMLLTLSGHDARVAHDGAAALDLASTFRPHVVLLDIGLPGMNGYEVAREMGARPECASALLVAMTGYGQEEDRRRSKDAGFAYHLVKPIDPAALERVIASAACEG